MTGASPVVDVTTAAHTATLDREAIDVIPTGRSIQGMAQLVVGINLSLPDTGGARAMQQTYMNTHGMAAANVTVLVDGMMVNGLQADGAVQSYFNDAMNSEVSYQTAGINAETAAGGVRLDDSPRGRQPLQRRFQDGEPPGRLAVDNLTERHIDRGLEAGNATDRIIDYTFALGGPIMKDKLWFFTSAALLGEQLHRQHVLRRRQPGRGRSVHQERDGAADVAGVAAQQVHRVLRRGRQVSRARHAEQLRSGDGVLRAGSPPAHHDQRQMVVAVHERMFLEAGWSSNLEYYTNSYQEGVEEPRGTAAWFAKASRNDLDLGNLKTAPQSRITESPARYAMMGRHLPPGAHTLKLACSPPGGRSPTPVTPTGSGAASQHLDRHPLYGARQRAGAQHAARLRRAVELRPGLLRPGFADLQPPDDQRRPALREGEGASAGRRVPGRPVRARSFEPIENLPDWSNFALLRDGLRPVRQRQDGAEMLRSTATTWLRTTGIASQVTRCSTRPRPAVARRQRRRHRPGRARVHGLPVGRLRDQLRAAVLEPESRRLPPMGTTRRTWNLEQGAEIQHEPLPNPSLAGSWYEAPSRT